LGIVANAKDQEFEYNQNMPYQRALQNYYQTKQSGATNMFGGVQDMVGAAGIASQEKQSNKWMDMLYGNGQQPGREFLHHHSITTTICQTFHICNHNSRAIGEVCCTVCYSNLSNR